MSFDARAVVKRLGRAHARELSEDDARGLFAAMLNDEVDDATLGAAWMGLRIKGESQSELRAFLDAAEATCQRWLIAPGCTLPLVIPSYNGARLLPNLVPLLAHLLARAGMPVLVHGVRSDPVRTTTCEVFSALDNPPCRDAGEAADRHRAGLPAFVAIDTLAPAIARLLAWRWRIGVRGSIHTIAKMINPCAGAALRLVSVTHPDYLERMRTFFAEDTVGVLLLRGAEGEAVAHPRRPLQMELLRQGKIMPVATVPVAAAEIGASLPGNHSATVTAAWIRAALAGTVSVPAAIQAQAAGCLRAAERIILPEVEEAA